MSDLIGHATVECIVGDKVQVRDVAYVSTENGLPMPVTHEGEEVFYVLTDTRPRIVRVRPR